MQQKPIPILMYHSIETMPKGNVMRGLHVPPKRFAFQMRLLKLFGYQGLSMNKLQPYLEGEKTGKVVGLTFDDGYKNNLKKIGVQMNIKLVQAAQYEEHLRNFKFGMVVASFPQSRSPGNEQRSMWSSEAADTPGSRNYVGIKNPALDELIEKIIAAKNRKDLVLNIQALDRILTHQYYVVPHWYISYDRAVYWNKFSRPKVNASQSAISNNLLQWWWWDKDKTEKLKKARAAGASLN